MTRQATTQIHDERRRRWFVFSIAFAALMVNVDTYSVNVSLPAIAGHFDVSVADASWALLAYNLTVTGGLLVAGRLGDRFGLRRVFLLGFLLYALSSLVCALSPRFEMLVAARAVQGLGGAVLFGLSPAMVPRFLPPGVRGQAFGILASAAAFGMTIGAPLGGFIADAFSWRGIFMVNVIIGCAAFLLGRYILPDDRAAASAGGTPKGLDIPGGILSALATLLLAYGLISAPVKGWDAPEVWIALATGVALFAVFVRHERRTRDPLLDLSLFRQAAFCYGNATSLLMYLYLAGTNLAMPFYLARVQGQDSHQIGLTMLAFSLAFLVTGVLAGKAADRWNPRIQEAGALTLGMLASAGFALTLGWPGIYPALLFLALSGVSLAGFSPANNKAVLGLAPLGMEGMVAGAYRMSMRMGLIFGVCGSGFALTTAQSLPDAAEMDLAGFRWIYWAGALVLAVAAAFSLLTRPHIEKTHD